MAAKRPIHPGHEEFWKEHLQSAACSHWSWQILALELQSAIDILSEKIKKHVRQLRKGKPDPSPQPISVCAMLCGLMLENLFKAVLVSRTGAFNAKGEFAYKTHDLLVLANHVSLKLSEDESWLLERLTSFVKWAGRYPIPVSAEPLLPRTLSSGGYAPPMYLQMGKNGDLQSVNRLAKRIGRMLPDQIRVVKSAKQRSASRRRARKS